MRFRSYIILFARNFDAFPSLAAMVFSRRNNSAEEKVAKIILFLGCRSYIRHFLGAILMPFRPSLPWCFPIRELPFEQKEQQEQEQQQQEEKVAKIIVFYGFQKLH